MHIRSAKNPSSAHPIAIPVDHPQWHALPEAIKAALSDRLGASGVAAVVGLGLVPQALVLAYQPSGVVLPASARRLGGRLGRLADAEGVTHLDLVLPDDLPRAVTQAFAVGVTQAAYADDRYRPAPPRLGALRVIGAPRGLVTALAAEQTAAGLCRDLINTPAQDLGPAEFARAARRIAKATGLRVRVLDEAACARHGMGCLLAVGRASPRRPRVVVLESPAEVGRGEPLALIGKGVCFDTGGLDIKPAAGMAAMRKDMGGAATVLAAMQLAAARGFSRPVRAYLPLVDNAIDGSAMRPGDILTAMDGTTVEVAHTDAEGRLILADAIALAKQEGAAEMISVATLTGAALVALGRVRVPIISRHDEMIGRLEASAECVGERVWRLPFDDDYHAMVRGKVAQLTNSTGRPDAGCITAGCFLQHFAGETPFVHCDISPACWSEGPHDLGPAGATGAMVATLAGLMS